MLSSDILVFPTFYANECLPLVLIEAMQCGLPIITSREGGIPSIIIDKRNGLLINPKSPQEIANSIEQLYFLPEARLKMRLQARSDYENFYTVEAFEKNLANVLTQVIRKIHENNPQHSLSNLLSDQFYDLKD
ncbi:glycosyltransferase [Dyadobacter sp. NIV53]|uniref:glycosyltransferase n=1 Tax=Dyadobacter sp. NIV53 TaxID=2861765 RepID=UPI001C87D2C5|nr:glycosyltransferase family 4 protein [Dyadobacter sp. NIV53]